MIVGVGFRSEPNFRFITALSCRRQGGSDAPTLQEGHSHAPQEDAHEYAHENPATWGTDAFEEIEAVVIGLKAAASRARDHAKRTLATLMSRKTNALTICHSFLV